MKKLPMKILVVNLTRFGDLLQTSPTIMGLKELHPEAELTALVERNFADVCRGLPGVDRVRELDLDALGRTMLGHTTAAFRAAYRVIEDLVAELRAEHFDLALNYSSSRMSAVLLRLVGATDTRGWTMTDDGHRLIAHRWSRLFSASCLVRRSRRRGPRVPRGARRARGRARRSCAPASAARHGSRRAAARRAAPSRVPPRRAGSRRARGPRRGR